MLLYFCGCVRTCDTNNLVTFSFVFVFRTNITIVWNNSLIVFVMKVVLLTLYYRHKANVIFVPANSLLYPACSLSDLVHRMALYCSVSSVAGVVTEGGAPSGAWSLPRA